MITPEGISAQIGSISEEDKANLVNLIEELRAISESKEVSEDIVRRLENSSDELHIIYRKFNWRLINLLKLGYRPN